MRPTDNIAKLLSETPVPRVQDGVHRLALKQKLLVRMLAEETPTADEPQQYDANLPLAIRTRPWRFKMRRRWVAVAVAMIAAAIITLKLTSDRAAIGPPESAPVARRVSSGMVGDVAIQPPPTKKESLMAAGPGKRLRETSLLRRRSLEQCVADAQVIFVGTALDSAPAPPNVPSDLRENFIRFRVTRILKGNLDAEVIITRTPTAANEFIGHAWVVMLSPEYMAGKHSFAGCYGIKFEPEVKAILSKATK